MRTKVCAFACLLAAAAGGAAWAFNGTAGSHATVPPVAQSGEAEPAGCCVTGDCCCPGQGSCCDLSKRATADEAKSLKKAAGCCSTGNCCCPGAGFCCATSEAAPAKESSPHSAKKSACCSK